MVGLKLCIKIILSCASGALVSVALAQDRWVYDQNTQPLEVVNDIVKKENQSTNIVTTTLDQVSNTEGAFGAENKVSSTLDSIRIHLATYLEWLVFTGLTVAVILIIYNGLLLVMNPVSGEDLKKVQKKLLYIITWALMLTGFYFVLKVLLNIFTTVAVG